MSGLLRLPFSRVVPLDSSPCSIDGKEQALFPQSSLTSTQGYPLNFLCSPPALNERLGLRRSSASSLSQNSLYVNDGRPFWQYIVSSSTGCSDSQCFEELYNYYTTDKAWHLCDPDAEKVVEALRKAGVKVAVVSNFDT